jgi:hypothetical protein
MSKRHLFQSLEATAGTSMTRLHIGTQEQEMVVGLQLAQFHNPLRRLPTAGARVSWSGEATRHRKGGASCRKPELMPWPCERIYGRS